MTVTGWSSWKSSFVSDGILTLFPRVEACQTPPPAPPTPAPMAAPFPPPASAPITAPSTAPPPTFSAVFLPRELPERVYVLLTSG